MNIKYLLILVFFFSSFSNADLTGAGDAALYSQMVQLVATMKEELVTLRETLSIQEQMKDFQQLKEVTELSKAGKEFGKMFSDISEMGEVIQDFKDDPYGTKEIENEVKSIELMLERADDQNGLASAKTYARILSDLKHLQFLGKINEENTKTMSSGMNSDDAVKMSAENTLIMSTLIQKKEQKEAVQNARTTDAVQKLWGGSKYESMGGN